MTQKTCQAAGCNRTVASRYSRFCITHKSRSRRHGNAEQKAITKTELASYERIVLRLIERNAESPVWAHAETNWLCVVDHAKGELSSPAASLRWERRAAKEIITLADAVPPRGVLITVAAMFMLQADQPRRFVSDAAFRVQLTRRVRGLTEVNAGQWWDHANGKRKLAYKELPPKAAATFAEWTVAALGGIAVYLAQHETRKREDKEAQQRALGEALAELV
jgi:hypothetical protein